MTIKRWPPPPHQFSLPALVQRKHAVAPPPLRPCCPPGSASAPAAAIIQQLRHYQGQSASSLLQNLQSSTTVTAQIAWHDGSTVGPVTKSNGGSGSIAGWVFNLTKPGGWPANWNGKTFTANHHRRDAEVNALQALEAKLYSKTPGGAWRYPRNPNGTSGVLTVTASRAICPFCKEAIRQFRNFWNLT